MAKLAVAEEGNIITTLMEDDPRYSVAIGCLLRSY